MVVLLQFHICAVQVLMGEHADQNSEEKKLKCEALIFKLRVV